MVFKDFPYTRPDMELIAVKAQELFKKMEAAKTKDDFLSTMKEFNEIRLHVDSMFQLVYIRHSIDTRDEFYEKETEYMDLNSPHFEELQTKFYRILLESPFKVAMDEKYGKHFTNLVELSIKTFKPEIIEDLQKENQLMSSYSKLVASANILFEGEERNLSGLIPFMEDENREIRKTASEAYFGFFKEHQNEFDDIFDQLVHVRDKMAKKLGYENYGLMAYDHLLRSEYGPKEVKAYRESIYQNVTPIASQLRERQRERLGLESLKYYDEPFSFTTGNAKPKGDPDWIIQHGKTMYKELSQETDEFFTFMNDKGLLDLVTKKGKEAGGYCTYIPEFESPFIFSNFNGTSGDIDVLTHEAGHAFQVYSSRGYDLPEYHFPTYEACEIHSMSMEFFAYPWMKKFFEDDTEKYKFSHLEGTLLFLPYGAAVDEFQHFVYENPDKTPEERRRQWREIEKKYLPSRDYDDNDYLEAGGFFFKQQHIFNSPFYYIDYTLAQVCALQYYIRSQENPEEAWRDYVHLCELGGSKPFLQLVDVAGLKNPFLEETIPSIMPIIEKELNAIDDKKL